METVLTPVTLRHGASPYGTLISGKIVTPNTAIHKKERNVTLTCDFQQKQTATVNLILNQEKNVLKKPLYNL